MVNILGGRHFDLKSALGAEKVERSFGKSPGKALHVLQGGDATKEDSNGGIKRPAPLHRRRFSRVRRRYFVEFVIIANPIAGTGRFSAYLPDFLAAVICSKALKRAWPLASTFFGSAIAAGNQRVSPNW